MQTKGVSGPRVNRYRKQQYDQFNLITRLINFYSGEVRLVLVGMTVDENFIQEYGGRRETFEIATDEQLIGCEFTMTKTTSVV